MVVWKNSEQHPEWEKTIGPEHGSWQSESPLTCQPHAIGLALDDHIHDAFVFLFDHLRKEIVCAKNQAANMVLNAQETGESAR